MDFLTADELRDLAHEAMAQAARIGREGMRGGSTPHQQDLLQAAQLLKASDVFHFHANMADPPKGSNDD